MTDTRRLQRALFRMQLDGGFLEAVALRDATALASTGLGKDDVELLLSLDPIAVAADPGERRRNQLLGNLAGEFPLTIAARPRLAQALPGFLASDEFHTAIAADRPLPLAFGAWLASRVTGATASAIAELERALAAVRREAPARDRRLDPDAVQLAPGARLHQAPAGTFDAAAALRAALDAGAAPPQQLHVDEASRESIALVPRPANRHALPSVHTERLEPPVDRLLELARQPLGRAARDGFARACSAEPAELERFVETLVADGWLVRA